MKDTMDNYERQQYLNDLTKLHYNKGFKNNKSNSIDNEKLRKIM